MDKDRLKNILESHGKWLKDEGGGERADLSGANLRGADLSEKIIQVGPIGSRKDYTIYWIDRDVMQCGCWNDYEGGSLEEFKQRVDETYPAENKKTLQYRNEYLAAIAMFERLRDDARQPL